MRHSLSMGLKSIGLMALVMASPALSQESGANVRIDKLEREMRAVQRKVFGTTGSVVEPDMGSITPSPSGPGSSAPVADLTARVDAIESQLARLTGTVEENSFKLKQLESRIASMSNTPAGNTAPTVSTPTPISSTSTASTTPSRPVTAPTATSKPSQAAPTTDRLNRVKAVEVPTTGDTADDAYTYGYRLWDADLYPEAQVQLKKVVDSYPKYRRMSVARNLLGRAYLDDNQYENAVHAFYDNYKNLPKGERAADSLMYLGVTFAKMNNKQASCTAFAELFKNYGDTMATALKTQATAERTKAGCPAS